MCQVEMLKLPTTLSCPQSAVGNPYIGAESLDSGLGIRYSGVRHSCRMLASVWLLPVWQNSTHDCQMITNEWAQNVTPETTLNSTQLNLPPIRLA